MGLPKRKLLVFQTSTFRCYVSFREGSAPTKVLLPGKKPRQCIETTSMPSHLCLGKDFQSLWIWEGFFVDPLWVAKKNTSPTKTKKHTTCCRKKRKHPDSTFSTRGAPPNFPGARINGRKSCFFPLQGDVVYPL